MKCTLFVAVFTAIALTGCSSSDNTCEDITLASEQIRQCQALHRQIVNVKSQPLIRTELERRYQQDCIDIRFYRDEKESAMCGNKHRVEAKNESAKR